jgi:hypothetical protein
MSLVRRHLDTDNQRLPIISDLYLERFRRTSPLLHETVNVYLGDHPNAK